MKHVEPSKEVRVESLSENRRRSLPAWVAAVVLVACPIVGQAAQQGGEFELASVKLMDANMRGSPSHSQSAPRRISLKATLHVLILRAYGIRKDQIGGEPDWFQTRLYSVEAVTATPVPDD